MATSCAVKCCPPLGGTAKLNSRFTAAANYGSLVALPRDKHDGIHLAEIVIFPGHQHYKLQHQGFVSLARAFGLQLFAWLTFRGQRRPGVLVDFINFDANKGNVKGTFAVVLEPPFKIRGKFKSLEDCKVYLVEHISEMHKKLPNDIETALTDSDMNLDAWVAQEPRFKHMGVTVASINAYVRKVHLEKKLDYATKMAKDNVDLYMANHHAGAKAKTANASKARAELEGINKRSVEWMQKRLGYLKLPVFHRVFCVMPQDPLWIACSKDGYNGQAAWPPMWSANGEKYETEINPPWAVETGPPSGAEEPPPPAPAPPTAQQVEQLVADAELGTQPVRPRSSRKASKAAAAALAKGAVASGGEGQEGKEEEEEEVEEGQVQKEKEVPHALPTPTATHLHEIKFCLILLVRGGATRGRRRRLPEWLRRRRRRQELLRRRRRSNAS